MTTIAQSPKKAAVKFCFSLLLILGPLTLCQAQGVIDIDASFSLRAWQTSDAAVAAGTTIASPDAEGFQYAPVVGAPWTPVSGPPISPDIAPEPSTMGLLLAGGAALSRLGMRKRPS